MKKLYGLIIFSITILFNTPACFSQCTISVSKAQSIVCGGSVKLLAESKLKRSNADSTYFYNSTYFINRDTGFVTAAFGSYDYYTSGNGRILKTINGGVSWSWIQINDTDIFNSIYFLNANIGFEVGQWGKILKTTDGGNNWNLIIRFGWYDNLKSIKFISADTGFIVGDLGKILRTTNGGDSWEIQNYDSLKRLKSISFPDRNVGYVVGSGEYGYGSYFFKTIDAGNNWIQMNDTMHYAWNSVYFTSADTGYIAGDEQFPDIYNQTGAILKTSNGGKNWQLLKRIQNVSFTSLKFIDSKTGYATGTKGTFIETHDGGISWNTYETNTINQYTDIVFPNPGNGILIGWQTGISILSIPESFSWSPNLAINDTSLAEPTVSPVNDITYTVNASYFGGCIARDSVKVMVSPLLISANDVEVSCGNNANLLASTNYTGNGELNYSWSPVDNLSDPATANPVATVTNPSVYSVEVTTPNGCQASKDVSINTTAIDIPASICLVTVNDKFKNLVAWEKPSSTSVDSFYIYRESNNQTGLYDLLGKVPYSSQTVFTDSSSNSLVQSNRYKIAIKDVCDNLTALSPAHKTMHLNINQAQGSTWNLIWEEYEGFPVSSYKIYRGTSISDLQLIGSTAGGNSSYSDFTAPAGDIFYQVEVLPPAPCSILKSNNITSSKSNIASNTALQVRRISGAAQRIQAYPVPAQDQLFFNLPLSSSAVACVNSIDGKMIVNCTINISSNSISLAALPSGMYILRITDKQNLYQAKFIKD